MKVHDSIPPFFKTIHPIWGVGQGWPRVPTNELNREIFLQTLKFLLFLEGTPKVDH